MYTVAKGKEPIFSIWSNPIAKADTYRLMQYHVIDEREEGTFILNTVTGELALLTDVEKKIVDSLPSPYTPEMDQLIAHRFLVPDSFDEYTSTVQLRKVIRSSSFKDDKIQSFTILPTTNCNARCFYCYESDYPHLNLNKETADLIIDYIISSCNKEDNVFIAWFGGEPTLGDKWIDYICDSLIEKGIHFSSSMISNGYLFNKLMVLKAKEKWKLNRIQITLDGTEEVYNKTKSYIYTDGSPFERVIDNIGLLLKQDIQVTIRMNLDSYNADNLKLLIDELSEKFSHYNNFSVYIHEIFEKMGYTPIQRTENQLLDVIELKKSLESYIESKGLKYRKTSLTRKMPCLKISFCMADNPNSVLINPEGRLGKCQHTQFTHLFGDLREIDKIDLSSLQYWLEYSTRNECHICPLFPVCGVPLHCESGRVCLSSEIDQKISSIRAFLSQYKYNVNQEQFNNL
jgi:radical SAM protein with 4Fe4S-binding SPASM domain